MTSVVEIDPAAWLERLKGLFAQVVMLDRVLHVVDASVLPIMVSGNLNGPISALPWRAADVVAEGA
jgi:hypothetical protein